MWPCAMAMAHRTWWSDHNTYLIRVKPASGPTPEAGGVWRQLWRRWLRIGAAEAAQRGGLRIKPAPPRGRRGRVW